MIKLCKDNFGDTYCLAGIVGGNYQDHYYIRNSNGKIFMLSVAIEGTDAYDFQERERKENYTKVVFDKTFHQDCYGERYVVFDELPSNTPKYSKGHLDNNFVIEINKKMGSMPVPNIILNRYDLRYTNDDIYWVHIQEQLRSSTVGLRIHANRAWIGILRMPISPNCLEEMIRKVFSVFPAVHNISFQFTRFNPKLLWPNALFKESSFWYIQLPESHEALFARTSGHFRRRIKYERRRIERAVGSIRIERYATSEIPLEIIQLYVQPEHKESLSVAVHIPYCYASIGSICEFAAVHRDGYNKFLYAGSCRCECNNMMIQCTYEENYNYLRLGRSVQYENSSCIIDATQPYRVIYTPVNELIVGGAL